jgi:TrmH family RNA methyltransferase
MFVAEGPKLVGELLAGKVFACKNIYALAGWAEQLTHNQKEDLAEKLFLIKDFELEKISSLSKPNQVLAVFEKKKSISNPSLKGKISLVLDDIQDPGNLGTIIRIADWFGIGNVICSLHTADMYNSKVVQSTMASLQRVNLIYIDIETMLADNKSIPKFAAALQGKSLKTIAQLKEGIIIIGNESKGISENILKLADEKITISKFGEAESLNAAVAAGIILYEVTR